jgi:hypothetical protein
MLEPTDIIFLCGSAYQVLSELIILKFCISVEQNILISALEIMGPGYRTFAGMMICLFFAVALMILAGLAYVFNSWFSLALVTSVPFVSLFR